LLGAEIALVLFGIGGLVRFRTVFDDARQTGTAIIGTVLGLACGMSEYSLVALALAVVVLVQWWLTRRTLVRLRVRARRGVDVGQLQAAVTSVLQQNDFRVSRVTPTSAKREIEVQASTETDFDVDALVSTLHGVLPGARIRIDVS
jgi:multisubunit Na+/H+ antiporter MnhG subunit